ncbi:hypothetical protein DERF_013329 [Dermatophagoides farinae]|uniref:Uncharacterized protein n=1 Tax=Dermatophagoides farinae TaxID=6954 RepID=A0A922HLQ9_DERFA|nr:hypothetical protein DERF_013329 [Dermatophagoides farinae]
MSYMLVFFFFQQQQTNERTVVFEKGRFFAVCVSDGFGRRTPGLSSVAAINDYHDHDDDDDNSL